MKPDAGFQSDWHRIQMVLNILFCIGFLLAPFPVVFYPAAALFAAGTCYSILTFGTAFFFSTFRYSIFLCLAGVQAAGWVWNAIREYQSLNYNYYDTGSFSNPITNFLAGFGYYNSELQVHGFADHFTPNLLMLAPLYSLFDSGLVLIAVRFLFYLLSFYTLYRYCNYKKIGSGATSFILFFWTVNLGVNNYMGYEFQPSSLIVPLVFLLFELADRQKHLLFGLLALFSLGFKENAAFMLMSVGLYRVFFHRDILSGLSYFLLAFFSIFLIFKIIMPEFSDGGSIHEAMFDPLCCINEKTGFFLTLLTAGGFILLFNPKAMLVLAPSLAVSLLGNRYGAFTFTFHYQDLPLAVTFALLVHLFQNDKQSFWISSLWKPLDFRVFMVVLFSFSFLLHSHSSLTFAKDHKPLKESKEALAAIDRFRENYYKLPYWKTSKIYAQDCLAFNLSNIYTIRSLKSIDQIAAEGGNYFVVICDFAPGRWPIGDQYEPLKTRLREEVSQGRMAEHKSYYPLLIFEKKYN